MKAAQYSSACTRGRWLLTWRSRRLYQGDPDDSQSPILQWTRAGPALNKLEGRVSPCELKSLLPWMEVADVKSYLGAEASEAQYWYMQQETLGTS